MLRDRPRTASRWGWGDPAAAMGLALPLPEQPGAEVLSPLLPSCSEVTWYQSQGLCQVQLLSQQSPKYRVGRDHCQ